MDHIKRQCMFVFAEVYNELQRDIKDDPNFPEPNYVHLAKSLKGISFDQAHSLIFDQKEAEYFYKMNKGMRQIFDYQEKTETIAGQNELRFIGFPTKAALMAADCALALSKAKGPAADKFIKFAQKHITVSSKHLLD